MAVIDVGSPTGFLDRGRAAGVYADLSSYLFESASIPYQLEVVPYKRMVKGLDSGGYDCAIFFTSPERQARYHQVGMVVTKEIIIVAAIDGQGNPLHQVRRISDLEGKVLGVIRGANLGKVFGAIHQNEKITKSELPNYKSGVKMLQAGHVDLLIGGRETVEQHFDHQGHFFTLMKKSSWLQCSKQTGIEAPQLRQLSALMQDRVRFGEQIKKANLKYVE